MQRKYVIRRRVVLTPLAIVVLVGAYYLVNHIWWTEAGFCWGTAQKCVGL